MALPTLQSLQDGADFSKVVEPFIPQLYELPNQLLESIGSLEGLKQLYIDTNPLVSGFAVSLGFAFITLVVSEINSNYSQIDRLWSLLPNLYALHLAAWARLVGLPHGRLDLVAVFTTVWSIRLTFNYWRRGGYSIGSEDYRWLIVKGRTPRVLWFVFNATFISTFQSILLYLLSCGPAYAILLSSQFEPGVQIADLAFFVVGVALVFSEWVSDGQQWAYQTAKHQYLKDGKVPAGFKKADLERGFVTTGLWAYSRHPNFFAEQTIWLVMYQWSCYATNSLYSWTGIGALFLIMLGQGSTWLTESITGGKYPEYAAYQKHVGMFIPKSLTPYRAPAPKVIRTSELAKRQEQKQKQG